MHLQGVLVCLFFYLMCPDNIGGVWWAVGSPLVMDPNSICRKTRRLVGKQQEICQKEPEVVSQVAKGAQLALAQCQFQFRHRKWNCSTQHKSFGRILNLDTRETAFVFAVTAAGVVYSVTQACSMGLLLQCTCADVKIRDFKTDGEWEWGGCGDNVEFGYLKSKAFMDARRKKRQNDMRTLIQLHNNEAGRLAVQNHMRKECKCHGLSGSCALKTCWRKMPIFNDVGNILKEKFDGATKMIGSNDGKSLMPEDITVKHPASEDLIYSENSPDFCKPNRRVGSLGTRDRDCDPLSKGVGGCDILCCGRGFKKFQMTVRENCRCVFKWCCEVNCKTCVTVKTIYRCL
ncbi:protein Wnt-6 isoform X2 [Lingula anatina]|uniref:Protein Wnt n=1 Tax=Lingula anatina TaxID=7574 RepID=A0A1S3KBK6_LINAN|nr:protein Wnt-6 isoform X2 [Lingula anatina]|eukprot:XP_013420015.1 protein Wnt-6 isoform X2 [Lingula anatina]